MMEQQFVEYVVKQLVDNPDDVKVERIVDDRGILLNLTVAEDDLGRVIGKRGATAQALRNILRALGTKNNDRYNLKIVDVDKKSGEKSLENGENPAKNSEITAENSTEGNIVEKNNPETVEKDNAARKKLRESIAELDDFDI